MSENFEGQNQEENLPAQTNEKLERKEQVFEQVKGAINDIRSVRDLDIPDDLKSALNRRFKSIGGLVQISSGDLHRELKGLKGVTDDSVRQIREALSKMNLNLVEEKDVKPEDEKDILSKRIESVNFFKGKYDVMTGKLKRKGINTLGDLINKSADELLEVQSCGPKKVDIIRRKLAEFGLRLKGE